jgi:hypothetical protein
VRKEMWPPPLYPLPRGEGMIKEVYFLSTSR